MTNTPHTGPGDSDDAGLPSERPRDISVDLDGELHLAKLREEFADEVASPIEYRQWKVDRLLGSGGMGKVYLARHRQLGRRVALKILKPTLGEAEVATVRFIREAQALARVRHDNVLQIYQVDTSGSRTVIEMEYIEGPTLREWQAKPGQSWRTIVETYACVADGLAALHDADLLHRDIKPENLLMDADGRVKIVDLGLAVASREAALDGKEPEQANENSALALQLTADGALVGTLRYMAPEVLLGDEITKAADQFSLAVSLYEAAFGVRPFAGSSPRALADAILEGELSKAEDGRRRPRWLLRALRRALRSDPQGRFPSVRDFAEALRRGLRRRRWLGLALGACVVLVGLPTTTWLFKPSPLDPCADAGDGLSEIWSDEVRRDLGRRADALGTPQVERSLAVLEDVIDGRTQAWSETSVKLCAARRTRAATEDDDFQRDVDRRQQACLDTVEARVTAMVAELRTAEHELARHYTEAAAEIEALPRCDDRLVAARWPLVTSDPDAEATLARAIALEAAGRYPEAEALVRRVEEQSRAADPLRHSEALYRLGHILGLERQHEQALAFLDESSTQAFASGQDELACRALAFQVKLRAAVGGDPRGAARELGLAYACVERVDARSPILHADLLEAEGLLARASGDLDAAIEHHEQALALRRSYFGEHHHDTTKSLHNLANALADSGQRDAARQRYEECIELRAPLLGERHPEFADLLFDFASFMWEQGEPERARELLLRALDIYTNAPGAHDVVRARIHQLLASMDLEADELDAAAAQLERARSLHEAGLQAPRTVDLARIEHLEGLLALRRGEYGQAADALRRATALHRQHDPGSPEALDAIAAEIEADYDLEDFTRISALVRDEGQRLEDFVRSLDEHERGALAWYIGLALRGNAMASETSTTYLEIALGAYEALGESGFAEQLRAELKRQRQRQRQRPTRDKSAENQP